MFSFSPALRLTTAVVILFVSLGLITERQSALASSAAINTLAISTPKPTAAATAPALPPLDPILIGAGDIGACSLPGDQQTANIILNTIKSAPPNQKVEVFTAGDNAYPSGAMGEFWNCYDPSWGRFKAITHPAPGNHDYVTRGAEGYFTYFGKYAGTHGVSYYSYNYGAWHILSLDSNIPMKPGTRQGKWIEADLRANKALCIMAYYHHPTFTSRPEPDRPADVYPVWSTLYKYGVSVVISGHVHIYERFVPQNVDGVADPANGIREFIAGTGGATPAHPSSRLLPNSQAQHADDWGVLKFTLHASSYDWDYISTSGKYSDHGQNASCVNHTLPTF